LGKDAESFLQAQRTFFALPRVVVVVAAAGVAAARIAVAIVARLRREGIMRVALDSSGKSAVPRRRARPLIARPFVVSHSYRINCAKCLGA
jgi:uncharacterized protein with ACT and thioredoxin-like domain